MRGLAAKVAITDNNIPDRKTLSKQNNTVSTSLIVSHECALHGAVCNFLVQHTSFSFMYNVPGILVYPDFRSPFILLLRRRFTPKTVY